MTAAQLLAVVEVPRDDRVRCQAAGCNHPVFRRIHVVHADAVVRVYGSECFKKLFSGLPIASSTPRYTSSEGRHLSEEERQLLIENTERLIEQFESAYQEELARQAAHATPRPPSARAAVATPPASTPSAVDRSAARIAAEMQAKERVRSKYGVNPELPGWRGLVLTEMERLLREDAG